MHTHVRPCCCFFTPNPSPPVFFLLCLTASLTHSHTHPPTHPLLRAISQAHVHTSMPTLYLACGCVRGEKVRACVHSHLKDTRWQGLPSILAAVLGLGAAKHAGNHTVQGLALRSFRSSAHFASSAIRLSHAACALTSSNSAAARRTKPLINLGFRSVHSMACPTTAMCMMWYAGTQYVASDDQYGSCQTHPGTWEALHGCVWCSGYVAAWLCGYELCVAVGLRGCVAVAHYQERVPSWRPSFRGRALSARSQCGTQRSWSRTRGWSGPGWHHGHGKRATWDSEAAYTSCTHAHVDHSRANYSESHASIQGGACNRKLQITTSFDNCSTPQTTNHKPQPSQMHHRPTEHTQIGGHTPQAAVYTRTSSRGMVYPQATVCTTHA